MSKKLDEVQGQQMEAARKMLLSTKQSERYLAKKQTFTARKDQSQNAIRDLGVLPEEAYNKYTDQRSDKVGYSVARF